MLSLKKPLVVILKFRRKHPIYFVKKRKTHDYIDNDIQLIKKRLMKPMFSQCRGNIIYEVKLPIILIYIQLIRKRPLVLTNIFSWKANSKKFYIFSWKANSKRFLHIQFKGKLQKFLHIQLKNNLPIYSWKENVTP